ncbi:MAG TPA: hypothetical protein VIL48_15660 [Acidimicrobiales bacterium]
MPLASSTKDPGAARPAVDRPAPDRPAGSAVGRAVPDVAADGPVTSSRAAARSERTAPARRCRVRRGLSRRAALAIWAACLAGGVGLGVLTDDRGGPAPGPGGGVEAAEPAAAEDAAEPADGRSASRAPGGADSQDGAPPAPGSAPIPAARTPWSTAPSSPSAPAAPGAIADVGDLEGADARAIVEMVLAGLVPPFAPVPGTPDTTAAPPPATDPPPPSVTTTDPPASTTTETTAEPPITGIPIPVG